MADSLFISHRLPEICHTHSYSKNFSQQLAEIQQQGEQAEFNVIISLLKFWDF